MKFKVVACRLLVEKKPTKSRQRYKGYHIYVNFVDITSEGGEQAIRQISQEQEKSIYEINKPKTCHFGLACCFNFSIAIANKSNKIILFDYDPIAIRFNRDVQLLTGAYNCVKIQSNAFDNDSCNSCFTLQRFAACLTNVVRQRILGKKFIQDVLKYLQIPLSVSIPKNSPTISIVIVSLSVKPGPNPR